MTFGAMDIDREHPNSIRGNKQTKGKRIFYLLSTDSLQISTDAGEQGGRKGGKKSVEVR